MASDWALAKAAQHLFGDNFPSGAEVHIERLAKLLDEVKAETIAEMKVVDVRRKGFLE